MSSIQIIDSVGTPIPSAYVIISNPENIGDITYSSTNNEGFAVLGELTSDSIRVQISAMGYQQKDSILATHTAERAVISLNPKVISLDEVIVHAEQAFRSVGDTLEFKADAYSNGAEQSVEDLLARIPGIRVGRDGEIRVRGKGVHRVLIEGDDLTGAGYKLLTRNLESGIIASVQLLESYQQNRLLDGIRDSEDTAINLKLKKEVKGTLAGSVSTGAGPAGRHDLRSNLIYINSSAKWLGLGNYNTRGYDPTGELIELLHPNTQHEEMALGEHLKAPGIFRLDFPPLAPDRKEFSLHRAGMGAVQGIFHPLSSLKATVRALNVADQDQIQVSNRQRFQTPDISFLNIENRRVLRRQELGVATLDMTYDPGGDWLLQSIVEYQRLKQDYGEQLEFNAELAEQQKLRATRRILAGFELTKKYRQRSVLRLQTRYVREHLPEQYRFSGPAFFQETASDALDILQDNVGIVEFLGLRAIWDRTMQHMKFSVALEASQQQSQITARYTLAEGSEINATMVQAESNLMAFDLRRRLGGSFTGKYSLGKWSLLGGWKAVLLNNEFNQTDQQFLSALLIEPRATLRWRPGPREQWMLSYALDYQLTELDRQWIGPYFTGYQGMKSGTGGLETLKSHLFTGMHILGDWGDNTLLRSTFMLRHRPRYLGTSLERTQDFARSHLVLFSNGISTSYTLNLDQYVPAWGLNLKFVFRAGTERVANQVNAVNRLIKNRNLGGEINLRLSLGRAFEVHGGMDFSRQWTRVDTSNFRDELRGFLDVSFRPQTSWSFLWKSSLFQYPQIRHSGLLLSELRINHNPRKGRFQYNLLLENVLNAPTYSIRYLQDTGWLETAYSLQPRRLLFQLKYRL
ncbi:hypothetical protein SAMN04490243_2693 [Robiginitalea myxolifaciens]|uniref:CarboxypepD_reg-like domain-containing protein n=1 Tax=Robiginitalea myxolifaciens TaxID=400055 RepID=A0A1I6HFK7_9FLAO|nr:hypothetical protein SAMN04490243_2693 [Robiginitalea myxolifaciens]